MEASITEPLAAIDGGYGDYDLITHASFGCVLWQETPHL